MIDLHMHTTYSDGSNTVIELLKRAEKAGLKVISITDHDTLRAHMEIERLDVKKYFSGRVINGVEVTTSFKGRRIELLVYDIKDYKKLDAYLSSFHTDEYWDNIFTTVREEFLNRLDEMGYKYDRSILPEFTSRHKFETMLYSSMLELNPDLEEKMGSEYCPNVKDFFRKCNLNPKSKFFIDYASYNPPIDDVLAKIKECGGKVFFAHPYAYRLDNPDEFLNDLFNSYKLDGVECFHSVFTKENCTYLMNFAKNKNLLVSGGSDYHGNENRDVRLGFVCNNTYLVPDEILRNWNI